MRSVSVHSATTYLLPITQPLLFGQGIVPNIVMIIG
jgi:hypothetical protein